jgi:hypothetical protein
MKGFICPVEICFYLSADFLKFFVVSLLYVLCRGKLSDCNEVELRNVVPKPGKSCQHYSYIKNFLCYKIKAVAFYNCSR